MARLAALSALILLSQPAAAQRQLLAATQCTSFTQVTGGPVAITATPSNTWVYAAPADCPTACTICQSGCLFCSVRYAAVSVRT